MEQAPEERAIYGGIRAHGSLAREAIDRGVTGGVATRCNAYARLALQRLDNLYPATARRLTSDAPGDPGPRAAPGQGARASPPAAPAGDDPPGYKWKVLGTRFLRERRSDRKPPLDILGLITEVTGFGAILYGAPTAATSAWSSTRVVAAFVVGGISLVLFAIVELYYAKAPLLDLRLFRKRIFLNASLLGYVRVIALFGAESLMPLYLQSLRGLIALQTGLVLLPLAITGGISVTVAGRLYDRLGPRPLVVVGFSILMVNTWQLSQIRAKFAC